MILFFLAVTSGTAQNVLSDVYIKESPQHVVYNDGMNSRYSNPFFVIIHPYREDDFWRRCSSVFKTQVKDKDGVVIKTDSVIYDRDSNIVSIPGEIKMSNVPAAGYDSITYNKSDSIFNFYKKKYSAKPIEIKDCIYFNPLEKYIYACTPENSIESVFVLNTKKPFGELYPKLILPNSLRFYVQKDLTVVPKHLEMSLDNNFTPPFEKYLRPFYFRKYEVTNAEYREFVNWVRDSIARVLLSQCGFEDYVTIIIEKDGSQKSIINWKTPIKPNMEDVSVCLEALYKPTQERFYTKKEIDFRKLNYRTIKIKGDTTITNSINVYPDTNVWINDFEYSFNEPMTNFYFWHPAYNDYPVVGITYWQALAYLDWRTRQEQKKLDSKGIKMIVEYDLPTEAEWEIAGTSEKIEKHVAIYTENYKYLTDNSWITDLCLTPTNLISHDSLDKKTNTKYINSRRDLLFEQEKWNTTFPGSFIIDRIFHTYKSDLTQVQKKDLTPPKYSYSHPEKETNDAWSLLMCNKDALGISFMGGNVSEWLKESYADNWQAVFLKHQKALSTIKGNDAEILSEIERYYDEKNDKDGRLVRGANWYDERFSNRLGKNTEGTNAKVFVSPDKSHSTLGFRYVIHYTPKTL